jgi:hypothetical protein
MARRIPWREWDATQLANSAEQFITRSSNADRMQRTGFALTPLGRAVLRAADARTMTATPYAPALSSSVRCCVWCDTPLRDGEPIEVLGGDVLHREPCLAEFDEMSRYDRATGAEDTTYEADREDGR